MGEIKLSNTEAKIFSLVRAGKSNHEIAEEIGWQEPSVRVAVHRIRKRLNFKNRAHMMGQI